MKRSPAPQRRTRVRRTAIRKVPDKELDRLCREIVFRRDRYACIWCGDMNAYAIEGGERTIYHGIQWAHVFSRNKKSMRWDPDNSMTLCGGCHLKWHHAPTAASAWFSAAFPERDARLKLMAATPQKIDRALILVALKQQLGER